MRKRLVSGMLAAVLIVGMLSGCGSSAGETAAQTTPDAVAAEEESAQEEAKEEISEEGTEIETAELTEESKAMWYMCEEGFKNDELNALIRRSNEEIDLEMSLVFRVKHEGGIVSDMPVHCRYYDGTLDQYLVQNPKYQKENWGEYEYAYSETEMQSDVVFIGNGVVLEVTMSIHGRLEGEDRNDYMTRAGLQAYKESFGDCLAYLTEEGLYCPALGLSMTKKGTRGNGSDFFGRIEISDQDGSCTFQENTDGASAQESLDHYVEYYMTSDSSSKVTVSEEVLERSIGDVLHIGKEGILTYKDSGEKRYLCVFYSDDTPYRIRIWSEREDYESYLSLIEVMP